MSMTDLPRIVIGTGRFAARCLDDHLELLDAAYEHGLRAIDTAHIYGEGDAERIIGRWLRARGTASSVVVVTKCGHPSGDDPRVHPIAIEADIDDSLRRLQLDRIPLCLLHRDDVSVPVGELVDAFAAEVDAGRIEAYGVSNWSTARLRAACDYARRAGRPAPVAASSHLSLARPATEIFPGCAGLVSEDGPEELTWYLETKFPLLAWSPLAGGFLSGRPSASAGRAEHWYDQHMSTVFDTPRNRERRARAVQLAHDRGLDLAQVALAYVLSAGPNVSAVVSTSRRSALAALVGATGLRLSPDDRAHLDAG